LQHRPNARRHSERSRPTFTSRSASCLTVGLRSEESLFLRLLRELSAHLSGLGVSALTFFSKSALSS